MLTIRLSRIGKKKKPMYRLIVSEKSKDPYGRALEILGSYNPFTKDLQVKKERIEHWISNGSQMSASVNNLLLEKQIIKGEKVKASIARKKKKGGDEDKKEEAAAGHSTEKVKADEKPAEEKKDSDSTETPAKEETKEQA